jgi:hypothetical protein
MSIQKLHQQFVATLKDMADEFPPVFFRPTLELS